MESEIFYHTLALTWDVIHHLLKRLFGSLLLVLCGADFIALTEHSICLDIRGCCC